MPKNTNKPSLAATERRLSVLISLYFQQQADYTKPLGTLAAWVLDNLVLMPEEFFEYLKQMRKHK